MVSRVQGTYSFELGVQATWFQRNGVPGFEGRGTWFQGYRLPRLVHCPQSVSLTHSHSLTVSVTASHESPHYSVSHSVSQCNCKSLSVTQL